MAAKKRTRSKSRHAEILDEAARQFNRKGVSLTAFREISEALGVTRRALYHYVSDREDLVFQAYIRTCERLEAHMAEAEAEGGGVVATLERFFDLTFAPAEPELCAITELGLLSPEQAAEVTRRHEAVAGRLAALLAAGRRTGEIRPLDTALIAQCILGILIWLPVSNQWSIGEVAAPIGESARFAKAFIRTGWAADRSRLPTYPRLDISSFAVPVVEAFDRAGLSDAKREKILATASRLFNRKGIDSTSLEEIAGELGATPRAVYHHVGDKAQLVAESYSRTLRMAIALQQQLGATPISRLAASTAFQDAWSRALMRPDISPLIPLAGFEALAPAAKAAFQADVQALTRAALKNLEAGRREGSLGALDLRATRLNSGVVGWLTRGAIADPAAQDAASREIAAFHALGIAALSP